MSSNWPNAIDNIGYVSPTELTGVPNTAGLTHSAVHNLLTDAVTALETNLQHYNTAHATPNLIGETLNTNFNTALGYGALNLTVVGAVQTNAINDVAIGAYALQHDTGGNNVAVGNQALQNATGTRNVAIGLGALGSDATPSSNTAIGYQSMSSTSGAQSDVAIGYQALQNDTGGYNVAVGYHALQANTVGQNNTAIGANALNYNVGSNNVAIGFAAASTPNTTGFIDNTAIGYGAMTNSVSASYDVALGYQSLYRDNGGLNVGVGAFTLYYTTTGNQNTAVGYAAGEGITTGGNNVAIGQGTMSFSATPNFETAVGSLALVHSNGSYNTAIGNAALAANTVGTNNTALGSNALQNLTVGTYNTAVGEEANWNPPGNINYTTTLGYNTAATANGAVAIGVDHTGAAASSSTQDFIVIGTTNHTTNVPGVLQVAAKQVATIVENVNTVSTSGSTQTIPDVTAASLNRITLTANCTLTFPTAVAGKSFLIALAQDATGSRTVTWPGNIKWAGGTAPTLTTTASKVDVFSFVCFDGTNWIGVVAGENF